jgi:hypothetical protein
MFQFQASSTYIMHGLTSCMTYKIKLSSGRQQYGSCKFTL